MNVANLELCKDLYELSGWADTAGYWYANTETQFATTHKVKPGWWTLNGKPTGSEVPAYDLGYLLRKLPRTSLDDIREDGRGRAFPIVPDLREWEIDMPIPDDTACKLAIELFKQGILTKEDK